MNPAARRLARSLPVASLLVASSANAQALDDLGRGIDLFPDGASSTTAHASTEPQVIYSNFSDGTTTLIYGAVDDAPTNRSSICGGVRAKSTATPERRRLIQDALQTMFADFNVVLAATRPTAGPYTMVMVGPQGDCPGLPPLAPGVKAGGVGWTDCANSNRSNIAFDFSSGGSDGVMAQELGHTLGLAHVDVACDVMGGGYSSKGCPSRDWGFKDVTGAVIGGARCTGLTQNSYRILKETLGEWPGGPKPDPMGDGTACRDEAAPTLAITEPRDGATVAPTFNVRVEAADDCSLREVKIDLPSQGLSATAKSAPFEWVIRDVEPTARLEIVIAAIDGAGRETELRVAIAVRDQVDPAGTDGGDAAPDSGAGAAPGAGAGCALAGARPRAACLFVVPLLVALCWRERRRARTADHGNPGTSAGVLRSVVVPSPSWP